MKNKTLPIVHVKGYKDEIRRSKKPKTQDFAQVVMTKSS